MNPYRVNKAKGRAEVAKRRLAAPPTPVEPVTPTPEPPYPVILPMEDIPADRYTNVERSDASV